MSDNLQHINYDVDMVFCIDATGSMSKVINNVKLNALKFHDDMAEALAKKDKKVNNLRIKVIAYRDYYDNATDAIQESTFFQLPEQKDEYCNFVQGIEAKGGGDEPESGLEALALALKSNWGESQGKRREVIVFYTDASAHPLESSKTKPANYPVGIAESFSQLTDQWYDIIDEQATKRPNSSKRLIIFAPNAYPWSDISEHWEQVIHFPAQAGNGLAESDYLEILDAIANSV